MESSSLTVQYLVQKELAPSILEAAEKQEYKAMFSRHITYSYQECA